MSSKHVDPITTAIPKKEKPDEGPTVRVFLPLLEDEGSGVLVDQYEHVSYSNETGDHFFKVHRGEYVDVPVPVFMLLKQRYPNI